MKYSSSARGRVARFLGIMLAASLLSGLMSSFAARAQPAEPTPAPSAATQPSAEEVAKREAWRATIARTPAPKKGCFTASYPNTEWQETPCGPPSRYPNPPARGHGGHGLPVATTPVGDGNDFSAQPVVSGLAVQNPAGGPRPDAVSGLIFSATGSFDSVTPANITETGPWTLTIPNPPPPPPPPCRPAQGCTQQQTPDTALTEQRANAFSLQLNTQFFPTPACQGHANCLGWQQFVFSQNQCNGPCVFIEYWLLDFGSGCPAGWTQWQDDCMLNSSSNPAPIVPADELQGTTLTGTAAADSDTVVLTTAGNVAAMITTPTSVLNLAQGWNTAEWNVVGDCCLSQASFSAGSTLVVRTSVNAGANSISATCVREGFTGESNNLFLALTPAVEPASTWPAIVFTESNATDGKPASCTGTVGIGRNP